MNTILKVVGWVAGGSILLAVYWFWRITGIGNAQEVYVVPQNFTGIVYILFDQPDGVSIERKGLKRVYHISGSGLLKIRSGIQEGTMPLPEFFRDSAGRLLSLPYQIPNGRPIPRGVYISTIETGTGGCGTDAQGNDKREIAYESFIVSDAQHIEKIYTELRNHERTPQALICDVTLTDTDSVKVF